MTETARIERVVTAGVLTVDGAKHEVENNTWIVGDDDEVIVIDAAHDGTAVLEAVGEREVLAVIATHGHADHVSSAPEVAARDEAPVALHPKDRPAWRDAHPDEDPDIDMEDGGVFEVADVHLEILDTPGHSPGSVCLYCEELSVVFSGDTLLKGKPGPYAGGYTDFAGQLNSIGENLLTLPGATRVLPGHGDETTIDAEEKRFDTWIARGPEGLSGPGTISL